MKEFLTQLLSTSIFAKLSATWELKTLTTLSTSLFPKNKTIITPLIDALRYFRVTQNMQVQDFVLEIPILGVKSDPFGT